MENLARSLQASIATIIRIQKIMEPSVETAHGRLKMVPPDMQAMRYISQHPDCMSGAVASFLGVVPTTMTSIVDRLVQRGFVSRIRPEDNRRAVALRLTEEGEDAFRQLEAEELAASQRMIDVLSAEERVAFVHSMAKVADAFSKMRHDTVQE